MMRGVVAHPAEGLDAEGGHTGIGRGVAVGEEGLEALPQCRPEGP